jgi:hypothetical protein
MKKGLGNVHFFCRWPLRMSDMTARVTSDSKNPTSPEFIRLPLPGKRCPITGLSRTTHTTLCELSIPSASNGFNPPVRSVLVKRRGALRGIRLINYASLLGYLHSLEDEQALAARGNDHIRQTITS